MGGAHFLQSPKLGGAVIQLVYSRTYTYSRHKTSYSCAYDGKIPEARVPLKPSSSSRKHNPQPRHLFLLRMLNRVTCLMHKSPNSVCTVSFPQPVCNVRSPPGVKVLPPKSAVALNLVHKTLTTSAKSSYGNPDGHPNFQSIPTRFGSNKLKMIPAKGIGKFDFMLQYYVHNHWLAHSSRDQC